MFGKMQWFWLLCFLYIEILGKYQSIAISVELGEKPSPFKAKLTKDSLAAELKRSKSSGPSRLEERKATTETYNWDNANLDVSPPPGYENETIQFDSHTYYNSTFYVDPNAGKLLWVDIDKFPDEKIVTHAMLSDSHRQATTVELPFDFPFYGSKLRNITIATGGFLYMGDYLHNWIAATQYIAPLMANFDTTLSNDSTIKYGDNGTLFTVQWDHVYIQDKPGDGAFTFQVNLFNTGDISFAYKEIPLPISEISEEKHPVKVGLSDAYILERAIFFVRRKTIYEYHRVDMMKKGLSNNTGIYFTALPTCLDYKDCESCMVAPTALECMWCETVQRCSDGVDRLRQSWVAGACSIQHETTCPAQAPEKPQEISTVVPTPKQSTVATPTVSSEPSNIVSTSTSVMTNNVTPTSHDRENADQDVTAHAYIQVKTEESRIEEKMSVSMSTGAVVSIVVFIAVVVLIGVWIFYAYRFPQSTSGQFLIKYRPAQWSLKPENEANSNAFHM